LLSEHHLRAAPRTEGRGRVSLSRRAEDTDERTGDHRDRAPPSRCRLHPPAFRPPRGARWCCAYSYATSRVRVAASLWVAACSRLYALPRRCCRTATSDLDYVALHNHPTTSTTGSAPTRSGQDLLAKPCAYAEILLIGFCVAFISRPPLPAHGNDRGYFGGCREPTRCGSVDLMLVVPSFLLYRSSSRAQGQQLPGSLLWRVQLDVSSRLCAAYDEPARIGIRSPPHGIGVSKPASIGPSHPANGRPRSSSSTRADVGVGWCSPQRV